MNDELKAYQTLFDYCQHRMNLICIPNIQYRELVKAMESYGAISKDREYIKFLLEVTVCDDNSPSLVFIKLIAENKIKLLSYKLQDV